MFNSTHTFVGLAIARTGAEKWVPHATITAVIASNLPDIDIAAGGRVDSRVKRQVQGSPMLVCAMIATLVAGDSAHVHPIASTEPED